MIDVWTLFACVISLVGVAFLTYVGKSSYTENKQFRYMINFLWFAEIFIWVSVMMLWG
jgi:hypothetical protein